MDPRESIANVVAGTGNANPGDFLNTNHTVPNTQFEPQMQPNQRLLNEGPQPYGRGALQNINPNDDQLVNMLRSLFSDESQNPFSNVLTNSGNPVASTSSALNFPHSAAPSSSSSTIGSMSQAPSTSTSNMLSFNFEPLLNHVTVSPIKDSIPVPSAQSVRNSNHMRANPIPSPFSAMGDFLDLNPSSPPLNNLQSSISNHNFNNLNIDNNKSIITTTTAANTSNGSGGSSGSEMQRLTNTMPPYPGPASPAFSADERLSCMCDRLASEVSVTVDLLQHGLKMRREQLLTQLTHVKKIYKNAIYASMKPVAASSPIHNNSFSQFSSSTSSSSQENGTMTTNTISVPNITFTKPDAALLKAVTTLGFFNLPAFAATCTVNGEGLERVVAGRSSIFTIITRNCFGEEIMASGISDDVSVEVVIRQLGNSSPTKLSSVQVNDCGNGKYTCEYLVPAFLTSGDEVIVSIRVNEIHVPGSPYSITINEPRSLMPSSSSGMPQDSAWKKILSFGDEGPQLGQFCRPWGVALSRMPRDLCISTTPGNEYMIAVADRSNNRIQLFRLDVALKREQLMRVFGSGPGARPGQLDRPAGISLNPNIGHVVVADKDNHRVQVFDMYGKFLFKFGEKGNRPGQFNYPWDIDCNLNTNELVVSDTRNRRIQVFTAYGHFVCQFTHHIDSPRGVAWLQPGDKIVLTDFNKHRMVIFDRKPHQNPAMVLGGGGSAILPPPGMNGFNAMPPIGLPPLSPFCSSPIDSPPGSIGNFSGMIGNGGGVKYVGFGEGSGWGELLRPQGVATAEGRIFCSDSRNNRVAVWSQTAQVFEYCLDGPASSASPATDPFSGMNSGRVLLGSGSGSLLGAGGNGATGGNASSSSGTVINFGSNNGNGNGNNNGSSNGVLDRPAGIAACDNLFVIVDFGHNRLHICQRQ